MYVKDEQHERSPEVEPKHAGGPLVAGCSIGQNPLHDLWKETFQMYVLIVSYWREDIRGFFGGKLSL